MGIPARPGQSSGGPGARQIPDSPGTAFPQESRLRRCRYSPSGRRRSGSLGLRRSGTHPERRRGRHSRFGTSSHGALGPLRRGRWSPSWPRAQTGGAGPRRPARRNQCRISRRSPLARRNRSSVTRSVPRSSHESRTHPLLPGVPQGVSQRWSHLPPPVQQKIGSRQCRSGERAPSSQSGHLLMT